MKCLPLSKLNAAAAVPEALVQEGERLYAERINDAAECIFEQREQRPVVLISGPSGSGKTTTAGRIQALLRAKGCVTHTISMDNYFLTLTEEDKRLSDEGKFDYEAPQRIDIPLFKEHLEMLFRGERIDIPAFDFARQQRISGMPLKRNAGDVIIIEGIHALNPLLTGDSESYTNCVYVSVRTRIEGDDGSLLHPAKIRLMRRLIRDKLYRGRSLPETFEFFRSVERGENLYIMPFKFRADFDIDTFIPYEPLVYRDILLPDLEQAEKTYEKYADYADIALFLRQMTGIERGYVPENSLIKEFIG